MHMRTILVSESVWKAIASRGKFGETEDDVLRREFKLPPSAEEPSASGAARGAISRLDGHPRKHFATRRMSAYVGSNQLHVSFQDGPLKSWALPPKADKAGIRSVREKTVVFALENDATIGGDESPNGFRFSFNEVNCKCSLTIDRCKTCG